MILSTRKLFLHKVFLVFDRNYCVKWLLKLLISWFTFIIQFCFGLLLAGSRSSSPGKLLGSGYSGLTGGSSRGPPVTPSSEKRSKIPRSQGCSRETSPNRIGLDRFGLGQAGRIPGSVNAMRVLSTSTDLEAAVADALVRGPMCVESLWITDLHFSLSSQEVASKSGH